MTTQQSQREEKKCQLNYEFSKDLMIFSTGLSITILVGTDSINNMALKFGLTLISMTAISLAVICCIMSVAYKRKLDRMYE